jgi:hypothetical protein
VICNKACIPGKGSVYRKRIEPDENTSNWLGVLPFSVAPQIISQIAVIANRIVTSCKNNESCRAYWPIAGSIILDIDDKFVALV